MPSGDNRLGGERSDRLGDPARTGPTPPGERQALDRAVEQLGGLLRPRRPPGLDPLTRRLDALAHRRRSLAGSGGELDRARTRHRDDEVEPVEKRA